MPSTTALLRPKEHPQAPSTRRGSVRGGTGAVLLALLCAVGGTIGGMLGALPARAEANDSDPFAIRSHAVRGLVLQVWSVSASACTNDAQDLLVLSTEGGPPDRKKWLTFMPCGAALRPGSPEIIEHRIADAAVVIDVAAVPGRKGPQLLSLSAEGLRLENLQGPAAPRDFAVPGGLPLPPRPWEISRIEIVADWDSLGRASALVPSQDGAWQINLESGATKRLPMPVYASYRTFMPYLPAAVWKWMISEITWPTLARADDNGDGRLDLFALSRWGIWIYHAGPEGLPAAPSRKLELSLFSEAEERRREATGNNYFARDLDGDGQADLLLNTIGGGMLDGESRTQIHLGGPAGVSTTGPPAVDRKIEGGFAAYNFVDLTGDGVPEIAENSFEFGLVQILRILTTRKAETTLRFFALDAESEGGLRLVFEDDFSFGLDFGEGRFKGLVPSLGDWNGDGVLDLYVTRSDSEIAFRMGADTPGKPAFGGRMGRQPVPLEKGESRIADLNGDGLDEIIAFTDVDPDAALIVLENLGRLPGTRATLSPRD